MAREIQQIMQELETAYAPQRQAVQERMNQLPGFYEAQRGGVETARTNAYQDITRQANARGMVYSGATKEMETLTSPSPTLRSRG